MLKNITGTVTTLLDGTERVAERLSNITVDSLDVLAEEVSIALEVAQSSRPQKLKLAGLEMDYEVRKAEMKLTGKMSALEKLIEKSKARDK